MERLRGLWRWAEATLLPRLQRLGLRERRRLAVALLLPLMLLLLWWIWLPRVVLGKLEAKLAARGLLVEIGDVSLALNGVELTDAHIRSQAPGLSVRANRIAVGVRPWRFLTGRPALSQIEVTGAKLRIELGSAGLTRLLRARRTTGSGQQRTEAPAERPALSLVDVEIALRDGLGDLAVGTGLEARLSDTDWTVRLRALRVGSEPGEVISLSNVDASGAILQRSPQVRQASVESAMLQWSADDSDVAPQAGGLPAGRGRTVARLRAALATVRATSGRAASPPVAAAGVAQSNESLWSDDARVTLKQARIVQGAGAAAQEILSGLSVVLNAQGQNTVRVQVDGRSADAGAIKLDLRVSPRALRAEGSVSLEDVSLALFAPALPPLPFYQLDQTRLKAELALRTEGLEEMIASGELEIRGLSFASEGLAKLPVGPIALVTRGEATWNPARRELNVKAVDVEVGGVRAEAAGILAWPSDGYRVDATFLLHKAPCRAVLHAVPVGLLDELASLEFDGNFAAKLLAHVDSANLDATKLDFDIDDACKFKTLPPILDLLRFQQPFVHRVLEPDGQIFELETGPGSPAWTPIELVSPFMLQAVVAHEDGRFFTHRGFAEPEIAVALSRNLKARAFRFGASTITMQLVKNVFLHRDKLLSRKVQEALITWWLEAHWDKRHILELYLNVIEYGPAIYGLRNAAWHYFGTIPMNLTPAQSAFLASILPSPKTFHALYDDGKLSSSMKARLSSFLRHMRARERIDEEALAFGLEELEHFSFYRADQPPPAAPLIRGTAAPPPFDVPSVGLDNWDSYEMPDAPLEDGSFGTSD